MKKMYLALLAMITCLCYGHQANAAVANITEYMKDAFLKAEKTLSCLEASHNTHIDNEFAGTDCGNKVSFRGRKCYPIRNCACTDKKAVEVKKFKDNPPTMGCYCSGFPFSTCEEEDGIICTPCPSNDIISAANKGERFLKSCDKDKHWIVKSENADGYVESCQCDFANHWIESGGNCVCNNAEGWVESNNVCVGKSCPDTWGVDPECNATWDSLEKHPSAKSGGNDCKKCNKCTARGAKLTGAYCGCDSDKGFTASGGNPPCVCDADKGWQDDSEAKACIAVACPGESETNKTCDEYYVATDSTSFSGGNVCQTCEPNIEAINQAWCDLKCYESGKKECNEAPLNLKTYTKAVDCTGCDFNDGYKEENGYCVVASCPEGYATEESGVTLDKSNSSGKSGGKTCYKTIGCGSEYIYDCCPAGEKCSECDGKYATTGECAIGHRINGVCKRWSDTCINYMRGKDLSAQYVMTEHPDTMNSAAKEVHDGKCAVDYNDLINKPTTQNGCKSTGSGEVNRECVDKALDACQERIDEQVSHWLSDCATDMGITEEEVENAKISDKGYGTDDPTDCCVAKGYTLKVCTDGYVCDTCKNGKTWYKETTMCLIDEGYERYNGKCSSCVAGNHATADGKPILLWDTCPCSGTDCVKCGNKYTFEQCNPALTGIAAQMRVYDSNGKFAGMGRCGFFHENSGCAMLAKNNCYQQAEGSVEHADMKKRFNIAFFENPNCNEEYLVECANMFAVGGDGYNGKASDDADLAASGINFEMLKNEEYRYIQIPECNVEDKTACSEGFYKDDGYCKPKPCPDGYATSGNIGTTMNGLSGNDKCYNIVTCNDACSAYSPIDKACVYMKSSGCRAYCEYKCYGDEADQDKCGSGKTYCPDELASKEMCDKLLANQCADDPSCTATRTECPASHECEECNGKYQITGCNKGYHLRSCPEHAQCSGSNQDGVACIKIDGCEGGYSRNSDNTACVKSTSGNSDPGTGNGDYGDGSNANTSDDNKEGIGDKNNDDQMSIVD